MATIEDTPNYEIWKPCPDYEALYAVSNFGQIKRTAPAPGTFVGRILKQKQTADGYLKVCLSSRGQAKHHRVHRLVLRAFIGEPPPEQPLCNHKNGIRNHNFLGNLEWCNQGENMAHAQHVTQTLARGDQNGSRLHPERLARGADQWQAKLTDELIPVIIEARNAGKTFAAIGKTLGISRSLAWLVYHNKIWRHVPR